MTDQRHTTLPIVGVTTDLAEHTNGQRVFAYRHYVEALHRAGGVAVLLPPGVGQVGVYVERLDGFILTGGDDPRTEPFGERTDARVTPVHADRQAFETALLRELAGIRPDAPVLGVCLGMQMMALLSGGKLDQFMPDACPTHGQHWGHEHAVEPAGSAPIALRGVVRSKHKQAVADAGSMSVIARAPDGVIEAICDHRRPFYLGVQWHPERTTDQAVGAAVFDRFIAACAEQRRSGCPQPRN